MIEKTGTYSRSANQGTEPSTPNSPHEAGERAHTRGLSEAESLKAKLRLVDLDRVARGKLLRRIRDMLVNPRDHLDDAGDMVSFGSTNDADAFRDAVQMLEDWRWDDIMREGKLPDLVADCRKANRRADKAEAALSALGWRTMESLPAEGFFLAWSPDFPAIPAIFRADIFASMRAPGTPKHLTANHFTHWMPCPAPPGTTPALTRSLNPSCGEGE